MAVGVIIHIQDVGPIVSLVVPKSYRLEGQPRSTRNEYPIRSAFGNSRQIQYGDL